MVGGVVAVDNERSDVGGNREVAASTVDSVVVLRMLTGAKEGFSHAFNRSVFLRWLRHIH